MTRIAQQAGDTLMTNQSIIIDRRLNGKGKSTVNRERFMRRYRQHIQHAVNHAANRRSITDTVSGESITISNKKLSEPFFHHSTEGTIQQILAGNKQFITGDKIRRPPQQNQQSGPGQKSSDSTQTAADDFIFHINREEFLNYLFEDLALPNMLRKTLNDSQEFITRRAGYTRNGTPERLHVLRSVYNAHARRIALFGKERREIKMLQQQLEQTETNHDHTGHAEEEEIKERINTLKKKISHLPFIDNFDLKYTTLTKTPVPANKAVMFCLMDVSGSMTRDIKDMAKRFFLLLYLFLQKNYESVEIIFIRHHAEARECNEEDFFYCRETGGTVVSSALNLTDEIIKKRFDSNHWNIYIAQASDGDNWEADSPRCQKIITKNLLPCIRYFAYVEITERQHQNLWRAYQTLQKQSPEYFSTAHIRHFNDIYPVFRQLFEKREQVQS
ncbi:MAG: YeaH/YhbH family protein [Endozoicomonadaceae bacterium]|nr:YeaH/YhbH family protein [Endozoicomonadaceae bacterium]